MCVCVVCVRVCVCVFHNFCEVGSSRFPLSPASGRLSPKALLWRPYVRVLKKYRLSKGQSCSSSIGVLRVLSEVWVCLICEPVLPLSLLSTS